MLDALLLVAVGGHQLLAALVLLPQVFCVVSLKARSGACSRSRRCGRAIPENLRRKVRHKTRIVCPG